VRGSCNGSLGATQKKRGPCRIFSGRFPEMMVWPWDMILGGVGVRAGGGIGWVSRGVRDLGRTERSVSDCGGGTRDQWPAVRPFLGLAPFKRNMTPPWILLLAHVPSRLGERKVSVWHLWVTPCNWRSESKTTKEGGGCWDNPIAERI